MRIIVTGGAGFIGSNLVRALIGQGHEVLNIDALSYAGNLCSLADVATQAGYEFLEADIADAEAMAAAFQRFRPEGVMHLAAESHVDRSITGSAPFIHSNIEGTHCLLEAARHHYDQLSGEAKDKFRFLHISTDEVYGSLGETGLFSETTPYDPRSPYSASKAASDHLARAWHRTHGLPVLVTNCSNNYGPYQHPEKLIPVVILNALGGNPIPIYGTGQNVRDWLHVDDHVAALQLVMKAGRVGETHNIGGGNERHNLDLARSICGVLDELRPMEGGQKHESLIQMVEDRPGHDLRYAIDSTKIRTELSWEPRHDHDSGIHNTVQWYLDHQDWVEEILKSSQNGQASS
jgi:dTDP-glucose 4,6-dehydratase